MHIGIVVIGRNEGDRLCRCLESLKAWPLVYVDSGSSDGSVAFANSVGARVVQLDLSVPFTAARARNEGFQALVEADPTIEFVMFVDGDCEVNENWLSIAGQFMLSSPHVSVVCGRRRERFPNKTLYNLLCDIEWDTPVGDAKACGGDALYRVSVFSAVNGFDGGFIAGEEPELCFRIRNSGGRIYRLDADMTLHDADMKSFFQWWNRAKRSGYAYYLNASKHGRASDENFKRKEVKSILVWGCLFVLSLALSIFTLTSWPLISYLFLVFLQIFRIVSGLDRIQSSYGFKVAVVYAASTMLAKFPQMLGIVSGFYKEKMGKKHTLVEYK